MVLSCQADRFAREGVVSIYMKGIVPLGDVIKVKPNPRGEPLAGGFSVYYIQPSTQNRR